MKEENQIALSLRSLRGSNSRLMRAQGINLKMNASFFFYFLPGGRIDHGHHDGKAVKALNEAVAMNKAVTKALQMVNKGKITPLIAIYLFFKGKIPHYIALLIESICILTSTQTVAVTNLHMLTSHINRFHGNFPGFLSLT